MNSLLFTLILSILAQNPLPSIVNDYVVDFRNDFNVRDPDRADYRPLLANVVRLAFHACVGDGGCDGCINMNQADNAGLELSVDYLEAKTPAWLASGLSKADLYALAHMVAANMALGNAGWDSDLSDYEIGRTDCNANTEDEFPDAHASPFQFFEENFGFSARDTTVIFGAHTLGRALPENSGFENFWSDNALNLGNGFYEALERNPWRQINLGGGLHQWDQNRPGNNPNLMALNADMFLIRDLNINGNGQETQCRNNFNQCDDASTLPIVEFFTTNAGEDSFQQEFKGVYTRMIRSAGQGFEQDLQLICDVYDCSREAPVTSSTTSTASPQTTSSTQATSMQASTTDEISTTDSDDSEHGRRPGRDNQSEVDEVEPVVDSLVDTETSASVAVGVAIGGTVAGIAFMALLAAACWYYIIPSLQSKTSGSCDLCWKLQQQDPESPTAPISPKINSQFSFPAPSAPVEGGDRRPSYWRNFQEPGMSVVNLPTAPSVETRAAMFELKSQRVPPPPPKIITWHFTDENGEATGPVSDAVFKSKFGSQINEETYVWNGETVNNWTLVKDVPELMKFLVREKKRAPIVRSRPFVQKAFVSKRQPSSKETSVSDLISRFNSK